MADQVRVCASVRWPTISLSSSLSLHSTRNLRSRLTRAFLRLRCLSISPSLPLERSEYLEVLAYQQRGRKQKHGVADILTESDQRIGQVMLAFTRVRRRRSCLVSHPVAMSFRTPEFCCRYIAPCSRQNIVTSAIHFLLCRSYFEFQRGVRQRH